MKVLLPSGDSLVFESSVNMFEIAKKISNSLLKKSVAAKIDGELFD
ncbi:MAG: TGS domain-containing protein, partial [Fusobacteriaceae bacterium]